ncbi:TonB-dependent receptor [Brevundimonas intermedia]|uniref:TonB-dependent receptor n=1 Tax=Brevundimonas intermedia TaxID=74315 RepID=A0ABQ5T8H9_9CAUL|nr:TonB-dependent receptor [Brevundimonas intermedia]GLK49089.1 TonB-dependent receptor [Brevundimonas intermedia]
MKSFKFALMLGVAVSGVAGGAWAQSAGAPPAPATTGPSTPAQSGAQSSSGQPATQPSATQQPAAQPAPAQEAPATVGDVTVTGRADQVRTSIDSVSYSLANDLQATTGSLADALRNVPSVDVDPEGNVSLRGDSNVTILVDGRPSGILTGPGRGQALIQLPASQYARIEVMTNPSAAYSPEGSGGVINLITKPTAPKPGTQTTGSVRVNIGDNGRWNAGLSGSWQKDRLTLSGDASYRSDPTELSFNRVRQQFDPTTGALIATTTVDQPIESEQNGLIGRFTAEYKLDDKTQVTGELRGVAFDGTGSTSSLYETRNAAGAVTSAYRRDGSSDFDFTNWGATARVLRRFTGDGHEWSNELRYDSNGNESDGQARSIFLTPAGADLYERTRNLVDQVTWGFTSAYTRPMSDGGKLRLGYELNIQQPEQEAEFLRGPSEAALAPAPGLNNRFEAEQTVHALYTTYERPLGDKLSAQLGLRLEQAEVEIKDLTGGASASQDYFRTYPTAHLQYQLSETQTLRASYSRRIQRPQPAQLNPLVTYQDPLNVRSGNPDLEPQETDSFEAMWQLRKGQSFYQATAYLRNTDKAFTDVTTDIGGDVFLTRPENLGSRQDLGVEATANGRLLSTLRYSAGVNVFRQEIEAGAVVGGDDREATLASGRISLNWQPTAKDFLQVSSFWQGDSLLAQGRREAGGMINLGYRRKLSEQLSFNFTARDLFNTFNTTTIFETPQFREQADQDIKLRAFYIGLTWNFGGPRRQPEQFDFSTGPTGG